MDLEEKKKQFRNKQLVIVVLYHFHFYGRLSSVDRRSFTKQVMENQPTSEKVMMKNNKSKVVRGVTEEVKIVSSVNYDITLVCKGGATVRK